MRERGDMGGATLNVWVGGGTGEEWLLIYGGGRVTWEG